MTPDDALRLRIATAARARLAAVRAPSATWWELLSAWRRVAIPVGLAAAIGIASIIPGSGKIPGFQSSIQTSTDSALVLAAFSDESAGGQLADRLVAVDNESMFQQAVAP
jgi:hypothetical protein